jgi:quinol monooxygenase YgiN
MTNQFKDVSMLLALFFLLSSFVFGPQAPTDTAAYSVAYVEILPASKMAAVSALKQYRDMSRNDEGFVRLEFFEQIGRPGHFAVIEIWRDAKSLEAHLAAAHTRQFLTRLDPIRLSDYDRRPYKAFASNSVAGAANDRAVFVITHVDTLGQQSNAPELLRKLVETSRTDQGNLRFDVLQHAMRPNHFTIVEVWQNAKALDAHTAAAHMKEFRDALATMSGSPLDERLYQIVE